MNTLIHNIYMDKYCPHTTPKHCFYCICSGTGATGRSSSSYSSLNKPPPFNVSKPSTKLDINTVSRPSVTHKARVLYDYDAAEDDEISLLADEVGQEAWPR
jgi:hypothetical protein